VTRKYKRLATLVADLFRPIAILQTGVQQDALIDLTSAGLALDCAIFLSLESRFAPMTRFIASLPLYLDFAGGLDLQSELCPAAARLHRYDSSWVPGSATSRAELWAQPVDA
jgi:hypothetical protein